MKNEKKIKFLDSNIKFKKITVEKIQLYTFNNKSLPLPTEIEISESGICNRKCSFCPRSDPSYEDIKEFISDELILKISKELKDLEYKGVIRFSGFVEPLLDKKIYNHIEVIKKNCPFSKVEVVTNGDPLNLANLKKLFKSGLDKILISVYDGKEYVKKFQNLIKQANLKKYQYIIRDRYYSKEKDFGITLSNRAGLMENAEFKIPKLAEPLKNPCYIPSYTLFFDYLGDVLMCPHDWGKKIILGNLNKEKLIDIWFSSKSLKIRKLLSNNNRNFSPCNICDVDGTLIGKDNSEYFK
jgi:radical SAM protein with 4Fe4S-binding SPASM domain